MSSNESPAVTRNSQHGQKKKPCLIRRIKSKGAILVLVWTYLTTSSVNFVYYSTNTRSSDLQLDVTLAYCIVAVLSPIAGFIAGVYLGVYKVIRSGLWLMWIGNFIIALTFVLRAEQIFSSSIAQVIFKVATIILSIGLVAFSVNSVPFGLDQMPAASAGEISAFIHWLFWSVCAGIATGGVGSLLKDCTSLQQASSDTLSSLLAVVFVSVALCCEFLCRGWFIIEPKTNNPIITVLGVLKFAAKHRHPIRRSAFTYCEDERPSRMDLGKTKYGGPFTTEQVEDVKTCLRMTVVMTSICVATIPSIAYKMSLNLGLQSEFRNLSDIPQCYDSIIEFGKSWKTMVTIYLLVYEILIYPVVGTLIPTILRRLGVAISVIAILNIVMIVTSVLWYKLSNSGQCMFTTDQDSPLPLNRNWIEVPIVFLLAISFTTFGTSILEFVCAQAPYNLRGLLFGLVLTVDMASLVMGVGAYTTWKRQYTKEESKDPLCNVWFYLFTTITVTLGCVLWCVVAKWYKRRKRDEPEMYRIFAENYYDH